jgi:hypothetical protein
LQFGTDQFRQRDVKAQVDRGEVEELLPEQFKRAVGEIGELLDCVVREGGEVSAGGADLRTARGVGRSSVSLCDLSRRGRAGCVLVRAPFLLWIDRGDGLTVTGQNRVAVRVDWEGLPAYEWFPDLVEV